jgi:DNA replication and repair protein RecF
VQIQSLALVNFRSYSKSDFKFSHQSTIIGENGAGKSNILEAIYLLATGKSFRADRDVEMIRHGEQFAIVSGQISNQIELRVTVIDRKKFEVNGVPRRMVDFAGKLKAVLFSPADLDLISGGPSLRRRYLDFVIGQVDREYRRSQISYEKGLRQRNRLLDAIREGMASRNQLFFWDKLLIKNGNYITQSRADYLIKQENSQYKIIYDKSIISESRLEQYAVEEVAAATTLVGPHRDDFQILEGKNNVATYGSRGQQRMAVLHLKMGELEYLSSEELPVLLLDDIFSELDHKHREEVLQISASHQLAGGQVIMTSADEHLIPRDEGTKIIFLNQLS